MRERDHRWRESGVCLDCGLDLDAMCDDVDANGLPTCRGPLTYPPVNEGGKSDA